MKSSIEPRHLKGFKDFYDFWAEMRDSLEDTLLERPTKADIEEQKEKQMREQKRLAEITRRQNEEIRQKALAEQQCRAEEARQRELEEQKRRAEEQRRYIVNTSPLRQNRDANYREALNKKRIEFQILLNNYRQQKPNANTSQYDNWESWDMEKLSRNIDFLRNYSYVRKSTINKASLDPVQEQRMNDKAYDGLEKQRAAFCRLLSQYESLKPGVDTSNFDNWRNWDSAKLQTNMDMLRAKINKIKHNKW